MRDNQLGSLVDQLKERDNRLTEQDERLAGLTGLIRDQRDEIRLLKNLPRRPELKPSGLAAGDACLGTLKTCNKLGVPFWSYLCNRPGVARTPEAPRLAQIITQRAAARRFLSNETQFPAGCPFYYLLLPTC